ncbi:MAG: FAD:protein FMN transferase [Patescibacteria group bacterium]
MKWREFKALGTDIIFFLPEVSESDKILTAAEKAVLDFEKRFSRFISDNELNIFNASEETEIEVTETMAELLRLAKYYYLKTGGNFDPTVIGSLEGIGYDKNFLDLGIKRGEAELEKIDLEKIRKEFVKRSKMETLKVVGRIIYRPREFRVDLGGFAKGYIVDLLGATIFQRVKNFLISAGGDIWAVGNQEGAQGWDVAVQNPLTPEENIFFLNTRGERLGIATSGILERTWKRGNFEAHHIIDPSSGLPVENNILSVTVISADAVKADIYAKTVLILGTEKGLEFIENEKDSACIIFTKNQGTLISSRANNYLKK